MKFIILLSAVLLSSVQSFAATLTRDYEFQNSLGDSLGGPSLVSLGGTVGANEYTFPAQQGLSLSNAFIDGSSYSIYLNFTFDALSGYQKVIDYKDSSSDFGLYSLDNTLNYFNFAYSASDLFAPGIFTQLVITRDAASGTVTGYVDGAQAIQFSDAGSDAVFSAANNIVNFFEDDTVTGGAESSSGAVTRIQIYDGALTGEEAAALSSAPEPMSMTLAAAGLTLCVFLRRRRANPGTAG